MTVFYNRHFLCHEAEFTEWMPFSDRPAAWMQPGIRKMRTSSEKVYHIRRKNIWLQQ